MTTMTTIRTSFNPEPGHLRSGSATADKERRI